MAREHHQDDSTIDRRSYLKATGTAVLGAVAGAGLTATSARAAPVSDNWEVRNRYIETGSDELGIGCAVTDPDGEGLIEHVYIKSTASSDTPAIWVDPNKHVGHLTIRNVHIEGVADNAIYSENHPPHGAGGTVTIEDCYLHDNTRANLRVNGGTEIRNTHVHNTGENFPTRGYVSRGGYSWYAGGGDITFRHCQIDMPGDNTSHGSGAGVWKTYQETVKGNYGDNVPDVTFENCQLRGHVSAPDGTMTQNDVGDNPTIDPPKGVPMTAEEAENGTSSATGPTWSEVSSGSSQSDSSGSDQQGTVLELVAADDAQTIQYEFTVDGTAAKHSIGGRIEAEDNDSIADNGDGTVTVTGVSGNGYGDAFLVDGTVTSMQLDEGMWTLRYGGQQTSVAEITGSGSDSGTGSDSGSDTSGSDSGTETETGSDSGSGSAGSDLPNSLVIDGSGSPNAVCTYQFSVSGSAAKSAALGSINAYDEVNDGTITGRVIGGKDAFRFSGEITEFSVDGPVAVQLDSQS